MAEAWVHDALRRRGLRVPDVIAVAPAGEPLDRGVLVVTAMDGVPLAAARLGGAALAGVIQEAGRELGVVGQIAVDGFGFVCRDRPPLAAPEPDARSLLLDGFEARLARAAPALGSELASQAAALVERNAGLLDGCPSRLAHGDFDGTSTSRPAATPVSSTSARCEARPRSTTPRTSPCTRAGRPRCRRCSRACGRPCRCPATPIPGSP